MVGGLIGWLASLWMAAGDRMVTIENIGVGIFGAFIGGDFIAAMLNGGVINDKDFKISSLAIAVTAAVVMLLMLRLMRRVVGPMKAGKKKVARRL